MARGRTTIPPDGRRRGRRAAGLAALAAGALAGALAAAPAAGAATVPAPAPGLAVGVASIGGGAAESSVDLYYQGTDHRLVQKNGEGTFDLGGNLTSGVAAIAVAAGEFVDKTVYSRGTDTAIWSRHWSDGRGEWLPWTSLGGRATGAPGVTCTGGGADPIVYVRGLDGTMWRNPGTGWTSRGGNIVTDPAGLASVGGECPASEHAFAIGGDGAVWEWTPAAGWRKVGGRSTVAPSATLLPGGGIDLFARGPDNAAYVSHRDGGATTFGAFQKIGGTFTSPVTGFVDTTEPPDRLALGLGTDGNVWVASDELGGAATWVWAQLP